MLISFSSMISFGPNADCPTTGGADGMPGRIYVATDLQVVYQDNGAAWETYAPWPSAPHIQQNFWNYGVDTGVANAYELTLNPGNGTLYELTVGMLVVMLTAHTNTGPSTLLSNGEGPFGIGGALETATLNICKGYNTPLDAGDLVANSLAFMVYSEAGYQLLNPQRAGVPFAVDTGAANAYVWPLYTVQPPVAGTMLALKALNANTGASTLNVAATAYPIKKNGTAALTGGEIAAGQIVTVVYDGANFQLQGAGGSGGSSGSAQTTVGGSTSGNAVFSQPFEGAYYKKVIVLLELLNGTASYTFPAAFTETPDYFIGASASGATLTALSTTAVTISGAPSSGVIVLEGY